MRKRIFSYLRNPYIMCWVIFAFGLGIYEIWR